MINVAVMAVHCQHVAMRTQCIQAVSQAIGRQITQAQAAKIEDRIRKAQQFTKAAEHAAKDRCLASTILSGFG